MLRMRRIAYAAAAVVAGAGGLLLGGCSSSPDEAQMKQLDDLKKEYAALQEQVASKDREKGVLDQGIAEKNARLKKCHDDEAVVRQRLGK